MLTAFSAAFVHPIRCLSNRCVLCHAFLLRKKNELNSAQRNNTSLTCPYEHFYSRKTGQNDGKEENDEMGLFKFKLIDNQSIKKWWILPGSNQRPKVYETSALTTELRIHKKRQKRRFPRAELLSRPRPLAVHLTAG